MKEIDLRPGNRDFVVSTTVNRNGTDYMGADVRVNAHDAEHAKEIVRQHGHKVNRHFEPRETKRR